MDPLRLEKVRIYKVRHSIFYEDYRCDPLSAAESYKLKEGERLARSPSVELNELSRNNALFSSQLLQRESAGNVQSGMKRFEKFVGDLLRRTTHKDG